ncbi:hypothetical protein KQ302_09995 [Synechococcus sp. CS-602]|uniref:hypothetical protein n=1 Tax=Synechococcaceae TaxID=1890426 RepID=UPI0011A068E0|nr:MULTISPECIES: hypothetical protein [Synechococcaceae]MCT4363986.1 hypothetical protein [Candidatus Regnicoccus frigidus MAG-AL1]MCT0201296.1 hypothetical protein [Synechococcus sp. CS-603]MCT0205426.1 hypothetical protein [Synechococcus sp. CS-602]MCT0245952.1 hypothetical protein [Synechococcus sp. CS-601]MCT4367676.1 hypothetical protein [Candidatus Regnicoccus frigidus MAG-AL2]
MAPPPIPLNGRRIVLTGLVGALLGLLVSVFLQSIVANTPVTVSSYAQFWFRLLLGAFACLAAMAIETVRQLQVSNPDPAYHQSPGRWGRPRNRP